MAKSGSVVEVLVQSRGSHAVGAHAAAATTLLVADATPFEAGGGQVYVDGHAYDYTAMEVVPDTVDPEAINGQLTLAAGGLTGAVADTMPVEVWNGSQALNDVILKVSVGEEGDQPIPVTLTSDQRDKWEARPGPVDPPVAVLLSDDYTTLLDAPGYTPSINGRAIVGFPDLPDVAIEPPASSPAITVHGNSAGLLVVTEPILPTTLLDYYVDGVAVAVNQRTTVLPITTDSTGAPMDLTGTTSYTVHVQAHNAAEPDPPPSAAVTAAPNPGMTAEMVAMQIKAGFILAGFIQVGVSMTLDPEGGFTITHPDGRQTYMRADGSGNQFVGQANLDAATILGAFVMLGPTFLNQVMTLGTGVGNPQDKVAITSSGYDVLDSDFAGTYIIRGLFDDAANSRWLFTNLSVHTNIMRINKTTGLAGPVTDYVATPSLANFEAYGGIVKIGTTFYVLGKDRLRGNDWYVYIYNSSWAKTGEWQPLSSPADSLTLGVEGSLLLVGKRTAVDNLYVLRYSTAGALSSTIACGIWAGAALTGVIRAPVDTVTDRYAIAATAGVRVYSTGGARIPGEEWPLGAVPVHGLGYDGTNWHTFTTTKVWQYTNLIGAAGAGYTLVDDDAGGAGLAETELSEVNVATPTKRAKWTISLPNPPPDDGTVDGANTANIYVAYPAGGAMILQTALPEGQLAETYDSFATVGTTPPVSNGFLGRAGALGEIISSALHPDGDPMIDLPGNGPGKTGPLVWDDDGHALGRDSRILVSGTDASTGDAVPTGIGNVTLPGLSITVACPGTEAIYEVTIDADIRIDTAGGVNRLELLVDGTPQTVQIITAAPAAVTRLCPSKTWRITGLAAGNRVFTARTRMNAAATQATVFSGQTVMHVKQI